MRCCSPDLEWVPVREATLLACSFLSCRDVTALSVLAMLLMDEFAEEEEEKLRVLEEQEEEVVCECVVACSLSVSAGCHWSSAIVGDSFCVLDSRGRSC